jgi:hypothetical protein
MSGLGGRRIVGTRCPDSPWSALCEVMVGRRPGRGCTDESARARQAVAG